MYFELSIFELLVDEDNEPMLLDHILTDTKEKCIGTIHRLAGSLKKNEYFEIFNDETQETLYFLADGTEVKSYKEIVRILTEN